MPVRSTYSAHRRLVVGVIVLAVTAAGATGLATSALFTDSATVTTGTFTAGAVNLTVSPVSTSLTFANMAPGDIVYGPITVANTGTMPMRYAMSGTAFTGTLAPVLTLEIKSVPATINCNLAGFTGASVLSTASVPLNSAVIFGSATQGQTGTLGAAGADRVLANGANEVLCARVTLPGGTTSQTLTSSTATFTFNAEQTNNNP